MYLFYVVVYLVIYLGTLFLQILMSLLVVKNQEISQEILIFIYLEKRKAMQRLGPDTAVGAKDARLQQ